MDQTDVAVTVALPSGICVAVLLVKSAGWPWYFGVPVGFVGGSLVVAIGTFLAIEFLARLLGSNRDESPTDSDN